MKKLLEEQQCLSKLGADLQFVCKRSVHDTIPFKLTGCKLHKPFGAYCSGVKSPYFRVEKVDIETCCALLTILEGVDMEGYPTDSCTELYSLRKTKKCIIVNLNCFCAITPLPPSLVNKPLPIIEPKK
ncbi:CotY/CotZ family spore coat protein [Sporosarcina sp. P37]|uniref:CotY/CotZ family spore coat protein n=2 Tax=Sporosarcina TaxID=1569 RepID=UPI0018DE354B|nr:CotY/CotZ family spore coat protein [Sporosarcina sp. P37]